MLLCTSSIENIIYKVKDYYETGKHPVLHQRGCKPKKPDENFRLEVVRAKSHRKAGSNTIVRYIRKKRGLSVDNDAVHRILVKKEWLKKIRVNLFVRTLESDIREIIT